jgi:triphosphatase
MRRTGDESEDSEAESRARAPRAWCVRAGYVSDVGELDWEFDAVDLRPVMRWLADPARQAEAGGVWIDPRGSASQVDVYLDTSDRRFHRAGYALRVRQTGRAAAAGAEATLKKIESATYGDDSPRSRREVSEQLPQADPELLGTSYGPVGERVRAVAGTKKVQPLFEVRTRRRVLSIEADGFPPGEIALDETAIRTEAGGAMTRLHRVEIEAPEPALGSLRPFVEELRAVCRLQPTRLTKYEAGVLTAGLETVDDGFGATRIDVEAPIGRVGLAVLRHYFAVMLAKEPGTRLGDDNEELHDMRVASRRLRAALSLFADVLPPSAAKLGEDLRWVGHSLGVVRDLDVQLEQLDGWPDVRDADQDALAALRLLLETERSAAREVMLADLDSRRYELFVGRFSRMLRSSRGRSSGPPSLPARSVAPDLIENRFRAFRKAAEQIRDDSPAADYHRVRIRGKRLRYALEFLSDLYPGRTRPLIKRVVALQDLLGFHQDAEVAVERLRRLAVAPNSELRPETIFAMGEIAERYRLSAARLRDQFPKAYARVTGKAWKAFEKMIEEERSDLAAAAASTFPTVGSEPSDGNLRLRATQDDQRMGRPPG